MKQILTIVLILIAATMTAHADIIDSLATYNDTTENRVVPTYVNTICPDVPLRMWKRVCVIGKGAEIRAFSPWKGPATPCIEYAKVANLYKETFGDKVQIWLMPIPTAAAFYSPVNNLNTKEEFSSINVIFQNAAPDVHCVDVHTPLAQHVDEYIYLRTDHHWAPLGAYYAAKRFAALAKVPFRDINDSTSYEHKIIHKFCGTMYSFSGNINIKNNPDEFNYWVPIGVEYKVDFVDYTFKGPHMVTGEKPYKPSPYFREYGDGSPLAYSTFMGGDAHLTHVTTATKNGRRVLFVKDSFGNAIPGYLFYSFEELHVVDCRYFNRNLVDYVAEHNITDIVLCNNMHFVSAPKILNALRVYLTQYKK